MTSCNATNYKRNKHEIQNYNEGIIYSSILSLVYMSMCNDEMKTYNGWCFRK